MAVCRGLKSQPADSMSSSQQLQTTDLSSCFTVLPGWYKQGAEEFKNGSWHLVQILAELADVGSALTDMFGLRSSADEPSGRIYDGVEEAIGRLTFCEDGPGRRNSPSELGVEGVPGSCLTCDIV